MTQETEMRDPAMARWVEQLCETGGFEQHGESGGCAVLAWPIGVRAMLEPLPLLVPLYRHRRDFETRLATVQEQLGALCWVAARIRRVEQQVHAESVLHGWPKERPARWPTANGFLPQPPGGSSYQGSDRPE